MDPKDAREILHGRLADQLLAAIVQSSEDIIISKTLQGIITSWNPAAERILGYSAEEAIGSSIMLIVPPELAGEERELSGKSRMASAWTTWRRSASPRTAGGSRSRSPFRPSWT